MRFREIDYDTIKILQTECYRVVQEPIETTTMTIIYLFQIVNWPESLKSAIVKFVYSMCHSHNSTLPMRRNPELLLLVQIFSPSNMCEILHS